MKKIAIIAALVVLGIMIFAVSIGALTFTELKDGNQVKLGSVKTDVAPIINGEILPGEYTTTYRFTADTKGVVVNAATYGYIEMNFAHDDEYFYIAIVIQEDEYSKKLVQDDKQYSNIFFSLGFNADVNTLDATQSWISNTLSIYDYQTKEDGTHTEELFCGLGLYFYKEGSMGTQIGTDWDFMRKICLTSSDNNPETNHRFFTRTTDANGKAITIYEFKYSMAEMLRAYNEGCKGEYNAGLTDLSGPFFIRWNATQYGADRSKIGTMGFYNKTTDDQQFEMMMDYGWYVSNLPHVMQFYNTKAEMDSDIAEWNANNTPGTVEPEVTEPEVTEPEATEPEATEPEATQPEATQPTTKPAVTTAANNTEEKSCGGFTAFGAIAALVAVMGAAIVIKKK